MIWENKAMWLDHTAVLHLDKVASPVLIFAEEEEKEVKQSMKQTATGE